MTIVRMDLPSMQERFANGDVDAVVTYPPASTSILARGDVRTLFTSRDLPRELIDVLSLDAEVLRTRPDDARALVQGFFDAVAWAAEHPEEANAAMAAHERTPIETFRETLSQGIRLVSLDEQDEFLREGGDLEQAFGAAAKSLFALGALNQIPPVDGFVWRPSADVARR